MTLSLIFDKIHQAYKQAQEKLRKYLLYLRYDYRVTIWLYTRRYKSGVVFLNKHFDFIMRAALIAVGFVVGISINHFGGSSFTQEVLSNYLVSVGMLLGGTIAIVFTISIFLLQGAADLYSSQYFEVYIHDWKEKVTYFVVIALTLTFFGGGLCPGRHRG